MAEDIREVIEQHHAFYEVLPYYTAQRIQAGFDIDVYGIKMSREPEPGPDYRLAYAALKKLVETIHTDESCSVEVIPFGSTVVIDIRRQFQQQGMLRIRITHKGLDQPAGEPEERALKEIKDRFRDLGLRHG